MCWGSKLGDYFLEGQRGLEIFARDLVLAMKDDRETADKSAVHVKYEGLGPLFTFREFILVQVSTNARLSLIPLFQDFGRTAVRGSLFVKHRYIPDVEVIVDLQQQRGDFECSP